MTTPAPQQVPAGQQPYPPQPLTPAVEAALVTAVAGLLVTAISAAAVIEALKLRFTLSQAMWSALSGAVGIAAQSPPPVTGVVGPASEQTSRQNLARRAQFVVSSAKRLMSDVAAWRAKHTGPAPTPPPEPEPLTASAQAADLNVLRRGQFAEARRRRLQADIDAAENADRMQALQDGLARERRYYSMHVAAMWQRATAAGKTDMAAMEHGRLLGWYTVVDQKTSAECFAADHHNYYADRMPDIGWPGGGPHPNCRCFPGPAWPGAPLLPSKYAGSRRMEMAMSGTRHLDLAYNPAESRGKGGRWTGGPAFHGTTAELKPGDLISPGHAANFDWSSPGHVYFTDEAHYGEAVKQAHRGAKLRGGTPHVYEVEPVGEAERDPDYAVSGGSFRSKQPLRVVGEDNYWKTDSRFAGLAGLAS